MLLCAAGLALACQQEPATEQGSETDPAVDDAAVSEAIRAKDQAFAAAMVAGDVEAVLAQYSEDARVLAPGAPMVVGSQAIRDMFAPWLSSSPPSSMTLDGETTTVAASGDYAHVVGTFTIAGMDPNGAAYTDTGKYVAVWRNVDGDWKMVADIWNSDNPPPGMASEAMPSGEMAPVD
jgi:uncharacterized protein (TIGR02246 family)